jgi:hypothetical protein
VLFGDDCFGVGEMIDRPRFEPFAYDSGSNGIYDDSHMIAMVIPLADRKKADEFGHLLAAAPQMLDALKQAASRRLPGEIQDAVDDAINKAEGRT